MYQADRKPGRITPTATKLYPPHKCRKRGEFSAQGKLSAGASAPTPLHSMDGVTRNSAINYDSTQIPVWQASCSHAQRDEIRQFIGDHSVFKLAILDCFEEHP